MAVAEQYKNRDWKIHPKTVQTKKLVPLKQTLSETTGPVFGHNAVKKIEADLTKNAAKKGGQAIGERMIVTGRVMDENDRPVPNTLVEVWQTNAAGRYGHKGDQHDAPLDPNFYGTGRCVTDKHGRYEFITIRPGAYPLSNTDSRWRPSHIHFSLTGGSFAQRLITQCYFENDPMLNSDFVFMAVTNKTARDRLFAQYSADITKPGFAIGYEFDIVLRGAKATPMENK